jgi:hypothetical protein
VQVQLDLHFIDALQFGELVEAKCRVTRRTRSLVFMLAELVVGDRQRRVEEAWRNRSAAPQPFEARSAIAFCACALCFRNESQVLQTLTRSDAELRADGALLNPAMPDLNRSRSPIPWNSQRAVIATPSTFSTGATVPGRFRV